MNNREKEQTFETTFNGKLENGRWIAPQFHPPTHITPPLGCRIQHLLHLPNSKSTVCVCVWFWLYFYSRTLRDCDKHFKVKNTVGLNNWIFVNDYFWSVIFSTVSLLLLHFYLQAVCQTPHIRLNIQSLIFKTLFPKLLQPHLFEIKLV